MNQPARGHAPPTTLSLVDAIKDAGEDFEWYPTTQPMLETILADIKGAEVSEIVGERYTMLDCGAGDGRALQALGACKQYAIEKSQTLIEAMDPSIFIIGTAFLESQLIDKKTDIVFSNPPYSEFEAWSARIVREANAKVLYLIVPDRWEASRTIGEALEARHAEATVIMESDFLNAERRARARVHVLRITLTRGRGGRYSGTNRGPDVDPFNLWFAESFAIDDGGADSQMNRWERETASKRRVSDNLRQELVGGGDLISALVSLYDHDLQNLLNTYKQLENVDGALLKELNVDINSIREGLGLKFANTKNVYWQELFSNMDQLTNRLTSASRRSMLETLTENTCVDFTASNCRAVLIWAIRNANQYFDQQLIQLVERLTAAANIVAYVSNARTFGEENWRYINHSYDVTHYKLDYRIVLTRGGMHSEWGGEYKLSEIGRELLEDLIAVASNLGFIPFSQGDAPGRRDWQPGKAQPFFFADKHSGTKVTLFEAKAFKNSNLHLKLNQDFIMRLNVEFGRLKGWLKEANEAAQELDIDAEQAAAAFRSNAQLNPALLLGHGTGSA